MAKRREEIRARIRRLYVPDAIYFITCVTQNRRRVFDNDGAIVLLRQTMHEVKTFSPFGMRAYVFLPDHFHLTIHVDPATNISKVMHAIKLSSRGFHTAHRVTEDERAMECAATSTTLSARQPRRPIARSKPGDGAGDDGEAMQAYSASSDVTPLLETLRELQAQQGQPEPELDGERRQRAITREDLQLVCYEYICS